jgi:non-ribosomal peptide synthetase component F
MYGPTETTIWSAVKDLTDVPPGQVTIGFPIANTRIYIVNKRFNLQPIGVPGEICISGHGLARGYWNAEALTNKRFLEVQEPFSSKKVLGRRRPHD